MTLFLGGYLDDPDSDVVYYFLLKAVDRFYTHYHRYPGNAPKYLPFT